MRLVLGLVSFVCSGLALQVPANIRKLYNDIRAQGECTNKLASGFYSSAFTGPTFAYCGDHLSEGIVYIQGLNSTLANMDVDCDGAQGGPADDGRCGESTTTIPTTSVKRYIESYNVGISDLSPHVHSFVVFGNSGTKPNWPTFDPRTAGVAHVSLIAVVCGDQMFYGVWGDSNGDHGERASVGEVSLAMATACYGTGMQAGTGSNTSHDEHDVLYIAFTGADAVPGADGASWSAPNFTEFHDSLVGLGDRLVQRIGNGSVTSAPTPAPTITATPICSWTGHCAGDACATAQDCADALTCNSGKCAINISDSTTQTAAPGPKTTAAPCSWPGHCIGATCTVHQDCADSLACRGRKCA